MTAPAQRRPDPGGGTPPTEWPIAGDGLTRPEDQELAEKVGAEPDPMEADDGPAGEGKLSPPPEGDVSM